MTAPAPVAGGAPSTAAPVDTTELDRLVEKALTASKSGRHALAAGLYRRTVDEALRLHGDTLVCTYLILSRASSMGCQVRLEGVTPDEQAALCAEAWALASSCVPLIVRRMDDNTMLPGRGTAVELAFFKRFTTTKHATFDSPPLSTRDLQLVGLCLGYSTAVFAAELLLVMLCVRHNNEAAAFVLRVIDSMLPAARSLAECALGEESTFASTVQQVLSGAFPALNAAFIASLRTKWTAAAMVQMRRKRGLLDVSEWTQKLFEDGEARWRADVAQHSLKHCALPSCNKSEVCVRQFGSCSRCRFEWYCSAEHGALHWKEHKPICRATIAAQQAADDAGAGAA